ncbi:site-specific integrase [Arenibacterium sp. LLYu02]|uniref:site-specific integrase n=1 Tax=Arenibacterium sp. LLYu02 TaxID=3404132 RepID=UPI003B210C4B
MKKLELPYLDTITVKGRTYHYFRKGTTRVRLKAAPGTDAFLREYWQLRSGQTSRASQTNWDRLITSYYESSKYQRLSKGTATNYRRHCEAIREKNGARDVRSFRRKHALEARDSLQDTWSKANERVAVLSILMRHAVDLEWIDRNPVVDVEKLSGGEYEPWPEGKLLAYEAACAEHSVERIIYELAIGTGQRLGDCITMKWDDFDGEYMKVVQEKTSAKIQVYCPTRLQLFLKTIPRNGAHILAKNGTQHMGKRQVQKKVEAIREAIGVLNGKDRLLPHGWRYTAATQLADAGVDMRDIQAVTGHKTLSMVQKYTAQANQKAASRRAQTAREQSRNETRKC